MGRPARECRACLPGYIPQWVSTVGHLPGRPPVVAYTWLDEREVEARWAERFLYLAVLNGHHRLEAYAQTGVPARIIAVARIEDSWGPPDEPARYLEEAFALFRKQ